MSIFAIILITVSINGLILLAYRQLDKKNRSLAKVKRYAEMVKEKLASFVEGKTGEINNLAIELQVNLKTGREILNRIKGEGEELKDKVSIIEDTKKRLASYDKSLRQLDGMSERVDENLKRIHGESVFVDSVGKRLKEAAAHMTRIEKRIPGLVEEWSRENARELEESVARLQGGVEEQLAGFSEQLDQTEHRLTDFSTYLTRLEARREQIEADTVQNLEKGAEDFILRANEAKNRLSADLEGQAEKMMSEVERKQADFEERMNDALHDTQERQRDMLEEVDRKLTDFRTEAGAVETGYQERLDAAARAGEALESTIFSALKKRIQAHALELKTAMENQRKDLVDQNLLRVKEDAELVEGLTRRIKETALRVVRVEKKIPEIVTELNRRNTEQLSQAVAAHKQSAERRVGELTESIEAAEGKIGSLASHVAQLERQRDALTEELEHRLASMSDAFTRKARETQTGVAAELELQVNAIVQSVEEARGAADGQIRESLHHVQERNSAMEEQLRQKINAFEADLSKLELSYKKSLEEAAKRGETLEHEAFNLIKERIDANADALHKEITEKLRGLEQELEENRADLVELFGNTRSDATVWRAEISQSLKEFDAEAQTKIATMKRYLDENLRSLGTRMDAQTEKSNSDFREVKENITAAMQRLSSEFEDFQTSMNAGVEQTKESVAGSLEDYTADIGERLEQERIDARRKLEDVNTDMQQIKELGNKIKGEVEQARKAMEESSQNVETRIDSFSKDYYERIGWASEQLESRILERVEKHLEEYEGDADYRFNKLEEVNLDIAELEKSLRDVMGRMSEKVSGEMDAFSKLINERREAEEQRTETVIGSIRSEVTELEESMQELKSTAYRDVESKLKDFEREFLQDLQSRSEGMESSVKEWQREINERMNRIANAQMEQLEQIEKKHAESLSARFLVLQNDFGSSIEGLKDEFNAQKEDLIIRTREERASLKKDLADIETSIEDLSHQLAEKTESVFQLLDGRHKEMDQDFRQKSADLKAAVEEQVRSFRSTSSDIKEKTDAMRDKLFGRIEAGYKSLAQKLAHIEEQQKDFAAQTKLFERADSMQMDLEKNIAELKKNLALLEPQRKDMQVIEVEFRNTRELVEEVTAKMGRFQAERKRIEDLEKSFDRLMRLSQSLDGKLESVTNHSDLLEEIQVKLREVEAIEEEVEARYDRLEKKKSLLDNTAEGIEKSFSSIIELDRKLKETNGTLMSFQPQIEGISGSIEILSSKKDQADEVIDNLRNLDETLDGIEERMSKLHTSREWLAKTETRLQALSKQAQEQVNLLKTLIKAESDSEEARTAPPADKRRTVMKLAKLGWKPKEIAQTTQMSRGEVELILELAPQAK